MTGILDFKTDRQTKEWQDDRLNEKLKNIVLLLAFYAWHFFEKRLMITEIFRTPTEQNDIYGKDPKYIKKPWQSVHMFYRGIDIRTKYFDDVEIKILLKIANTITYDQNRPSKKTAIYHTVGRGNHIHVQVF